jgi:protein phosphatase PTC7
VIEADFAHRHLLGNGPFAHAVTGPAIHPLDVIHEAWNSVRLEEVVGSSTICLATLDPKLGQLAYANLGDGGLMVIRRVETNAKFTGTAGYANTANSSSWKVAYLSQQQLRAFNLPYQLGFTNVPDTPNSFESPSDADTASIPVLPGDILVLATDGLFDNVDLNEIVEEVSQWQKQFFVTDSSSAGSAGASGAVSASGEKEDLRLPSSKGNEAMQALATRLVKMARTFSLDNSRDSPFALLAKENDIMWGGGMPDDTTVVVARVVSVNNKGKKTAK